MDERPYVDAIMPEPFQVLGIRLLPFSLGHYVLLRSLEVAFVCGTEPTDADVVTAAWICSASFEDGLASIGDPDSKREIAEWGCALARPTWKHRLGLRPPVQIDWETQAKLLSEYISEARSCPAYMASQSSERLAAPGWQTMRITLMRDLKLSDAEIMNRSYRLCLADYLTLKALDGRVTMVDTDAIEEAKQFAQQFAEDFHRGRNGEKSQT